MGDEVWSEPEEAFWQTLCYLKCLVDVQLSCSTQLLKAGGSCSGAVVHLCENLCICQLSIERNQKTMLLAADPLQGVQP